VHCSAYCSRVIFLLGRKNLLVDRRHAGRCQWAGAKGMLAHDEGRATCRAALLRVGVGKQGAFFGDAVDIARCRPPR